MIALETIENVLVDYDAWKNKKSTVPADLSLAAYLAECKALRDSELLARVREIVADTDDDIDGIYARLAELLA